MYWLRDSVSPICGIFNSKRRVAEEDMTKWHTLRIQIHLFMNQALHDFVILCIHKKEDNLTSVSYSHIIHLYKQIMNQTQLLLPLLLTFYSQEMVNKVAKSIDHFSPHMMLLVVYHLLVNGCRNTCQLTLVS